MTARKALLRLWSSPTFMTWGSFLVRSLNLVVVLPLVLTRFDAADIALWYLFASVISLQFMIDLGFSPTFSRVIAFAVGGLGVEGLKDLRDTTQPGSSQKTDWKAVERICSNMQFIYSRLAVAGFALLSVLGTLALIRPVSVSSDLATSWLAWGVILATSTAALFGNSYSCYLQGLNQIAVLRRWEIVTSLGAILTSCAVLLSGGGILGLVLANQLWVVVGVAQNRWLCRTVADGRFKEFVSLGRDDQVMGAVWPSAWRSGIGQFMTYGLIQLSAVAYAQFGNSAEVASYLLGLKLIQMLSQFSRAPFYSKLPALARLRAEGNVSRQIYLARKGMLLSYWVFVVGFVVCGACGGSLLKTIGSNAAFPDNLLWCLLGLAMFAERFGAMHIQLYSITNHIIWHTVTGISGTIYLLLVALLIRPAGVYAFPAALLASYLLFYCWFGARYSYRTFGLKFWAFESRTMFAPLALLLFYCVASLKLAL